MSRLTDTDYLEAHHYLKDAWKVHDGVAFGLLLWREQRALHDYFAPTKKLTDEALLAHRHQVTTEHPSLPHRAGKALTRCRLNVAEFNARPPVPYVRSPGRKVEHRIVVHGVARPDFDGKALAKLVIWLHRNEDTTDD
jgi:hypothetical protein